MNPADLTPDERKLWETLEWATGPDSLLDFMLESARARRDPSIHLRSYHLAPLAGAFLRSLREPVKMLFSVPPRFGKTEVILHGCAQRLMLRPSTQIIYAGFSSQFTREKSRRCREITQALGVKLRSDAKSADAWYTTEGGYFLARGRGAATTGMGGQLIVVDDAFANREEAESGVIRQNVFDWFTSTVMTRVEPGGSVIVQMTRWHDDDLIGRLAEQGGWELVNLPALDDSERSLWPERWQADELKVRRREVGEYDWASMFQGEPRPKGGRMFNPDPARYEHSMVADLDKKWRIVIGADPAATEKTSADYSVAVVMAVCGRPGTISYECEVLDVYRAQIAIPKFAAKLVELSRHWNAPVACETTGGFKAVPQIMRMIDREVRVVEVNVSADKFTRALPVSAAWNDGRVRLPNQAGWLKEFMAELTKFTGVKDAHDDQVDALVHAFNATALTQPLTTLGVHHPPRDIARI